MIRDFSESAKQKLLAYVKDVTETTVWGKLGDIIGDIGLQVQHWFGACGKHFVLYETTEIFC